MKICIVTVYNSINSGSFWQARALEITLQKLGIEVVYLKRKNTINSSSSRINQMAILCKRLLTKGFNEMLTQYNVYKGFKKANKVFEIIPNKEMYFKDIDLFILGSDTIWNLDVKFFEKNYRIFFGGIFKDKKVISYAASIANTHIEKLKEHKDIPMMLDNMKAISVRDEQTYKVINELSKNDIELVCDPTLLLTKKDYMEMENKPKDKNYIFMYLFSKLTNEQIEDIRNFAKSNGLKIIDVNNSYTYRDKDIINTPNNFLNYMLYADFIVTDTFHGTVFASNFQKRFVVVNKNKKKVNNFLKMINLESRLVNNDGIISEKFLEEIDYISCNQEIEKFRNKSIEFIKKQLR